MKVSVLFPTTGRPDRAHRCLTQLRETAEVEIVAAVDSDPVTAKRIAPLVDTLDVCPDHRGRPASWNACLSHATGEQIVFAADDLVWHPGWLEAAQAEMQKFPDGWGMVGFNDGHWDGNELATHYLLSRRFVCEVLGGVVAWPHYGHGKNDRETNARAKRANRYRWAEDAHVTHEHFIWGTRKQDETDRRALVNRASTDRIYAEREAAGFPNDYEPVIEC